MLSCIYIASGCGYTTQAVLPEDIKTIHVEVFRNNIDITKEVSAKDKYEVYRPNLEVDIRDAIISRIFLDGNFKIASGKAADAVLTGEILHYRKDPLRYQNDDVTEYRITLVCDFRLKTTLGSKILLKESKITGDTTYFTTGSLQASETSALEAAMNDLAKNIIDKLVENW